MKKYHAIIKVDLTVAPEVMALTKAEAEKKIHHLPMEKLLAHINDISTVDIWSIDEVEQLSWLLSFLKKCFGATKYETVVPKFLWF